MDTEQLKAMAVDVVAAAKGAMERMIAPLVQRQTSAEQRLAELERRLNELERQRN